MSLGGKELSLIFQETLNFVKKMKHKYQQPSISLTHLAVEHLKKVSNLYNQKIIIKKLQKKNPSYGKNTEGFSVKIM